SSTPPPQQHQLQQHAGGCGGSLLQVDDDRLFHSLAGFFTSSTSAIPAAVSTSAATAPAVLSIADIDVNLLAQQLTLIEHAQFRRIRLGEFFEQDWLRHAESSAAELSGEEPSRLVSLIGWFNRVAYSLATMVLSQPKLGDRITVLKKLIRTGAECLKMNNFNTTFEIVAGLNLSPVTRLKKTVGGLTVISGILDLTTLKTPSIPPSFSYGRFLFSQWKNLPSKYHEIWAQLNKIAASEGSYKTYRGLIQPLQQRPPGTAMLPYLGVNLKDLTFTEDGNPTFLDAAVGAEPFPSSAAQTGFSSSSSSSSSSPTSSSSTHHCPSMPVINFSKFYMISVLFDGVLAAQQGSYGFPVDMAVQRWIKTGWPVLLDKELYEMSLECEPRGK
ncbi:ras guanine nucleotide exchange factor domain-containing protein, partial [Zopfochytrium polystomum]